MARRKQMTAAEFDSYVNSRIDEFLKEKIMEDAILRENRILREVFSVGFYEGIKAQHEIIQQVVKGDAL